MEHELLQVHSRCLASDRPPAVLARWERSPPSPHPSSRHAQDSCGLCTLPCLRGEQGAWGGRGAGLAPPPSLSRPLCPPHTAQVEGEGGCWALVGQAWQACAGAGLILLGSVMRFGCEPSTLTKLSLTQSRAAVQVSRVPLFWATTQEGEGGISFI